MFWRQDRPRIILNECYCVCVWVEAWRLGVETLLSPERWEPVFALGFWVFGLISEDGCRTQFVSRSRLASQAKQPSRLRHYTFFVKVILVLLVLFKAVRRASRCASKSSGWHGLHPFGGSTQTQRGGAHCSPRPSWDDQRLE